MNTQCQLQDLLCLLTSSDIPFPTRTGHHRLLCLAETRCHNVYGYVGRLLRRQHGRLPGLLSDELLFHKRHEAERARRVLLPLLARNDSGLADERLRQAAPREDPLYATCSNCCCTPHDIGNLATVKHWPLVSP